MTIITSRTIQVTLGNPKWLESHREKVCCLFPDDWTAVIEVDHGSIARGLKDLGVCYFGAVELLKVMEFLERIKFIEFKNLDIRRVPKDIKPGKIPLLPEFVVDNSAFNPDDSECTK